MLPGLRLVLAAITATFVIVVLGFAQLVKLQVAQSHSASFGPVEARFAGLAFAERADWTPIAAPQARSLEALAPFGRLVPPPPQAPRPDHAAANAAPTQVAALDKPLIEPSAEAAAARATPIIVASLAISPQDDTAFAATEATASVLTEHPLPERTAPEEAFVEPDASGTADSGANRHGTTVSAPTVNVAALPPPRITLTQTAAIQSPIEVQVAALYAPVDPVPAALSAAIPAAPMPPAAETPPQPSQQVAALPEDDPGEIEDAAKSAPDLPQPSVRLPPPRPAQVAVAAGIVPLPLPRPATAPPPVRRVQQRRPATAPANNRTLPNRAAPAQPAASAAPRNPLAELFGGPNAAGNTAN